MQKEAPQTEMRHDRPHDQTKSTRSICEAAVVRALETRVSECRPACCRKLRNEAANPLSYVDLRSWTAAVNTKLVCLLAKGGQVALFCGLD